MEYRWKTNFKAPLAKYVKRTKPKGKITGAWKKTPEKEDAYEGSRCPCGGKLEHKAEWLIPWLHEKHIELQCDTCTFFFIHSRYLPGSIMLKPCYSCDKSTDGDWNNKGTPCKAVKSCEEYQRWHEESENIVL